MQFLKMEIIEYPDPEPWDEKAFDVIDKIEQETGYTYLAEYIDGDVMLAVQDQLARIWK